MIDQQLPMAGQEPAQQPSQQEPAQQPAKGQQKGPFPASKGEAMQFANDILQVIYSEKIYPNILKQLDAVNQVNVGKGVGIIAGHIIGNRAADVRGQTGRKLEMRLMVDGTKQVVEELAEISALNQYFTMNGAQKKEAFATALKVLDDMGGSRQPQQQAQPQQEQPLPQALPGGQV